MTVNPRSLSEIEQDLVASMAERLPEHVTSEGSDNRQRLAVVATSAWHLQARIAQAERNAVPDGLADENGVGRWARVLRVPRNGATIATGDRALRITGTPGSTISVGTPLTFAANGSLYQVTEDATIPSSGIVDVNIASITTGPAGRRAVHDVLAFDSAPSGVNTDAEIIADLLGGLEQEPFTQWQARVARQFVLSRARVTAEDWQAAAEALDTVDRAFVHPARGGVGSLDLALLRNGRGNGRLLTMTERDAAYSELNAGRIITQLGWRVLEVVTQEVDIEVQIRERYGLTQVWDWGTDESIEITAYNADTRTLTLATRPSNLVRGKRIVIVDNSGAMTGAISTVTDTSGVDQISVDTAHAFVFNAMQSPRIYAGGGLTEPTRQAIYAYMDKLGPAVGTTGLGVWDDAVRISLLENAVLGNVQEVFRVNVVAPVADIIPADPPPGLSDTSILLLISRNVVVRRWIS